MREHPCEWKYTSTEEPGLHTVISPENSCCTQTSVFRLNLPKGASYRLESEKLELSAVVIAGACSVTCGVVSDTLSLKDSFFAPGNHTIAIEALEQCSLFIGGAESDGSGAFFARHLDEGRAPGEIYQIHGQPPYRREVHMCINQEVPAAKLITGITRGDEGKWTSWPPHQHSEHLEEVYCYFDIPRPGFALHLASRTPGIIECVHPVSTGDCVVVPEGYHPTVSMPGVASCYFWIMAAHRQESRRYDLAENDPHFG